MEQSILAQQVAETQRAYTSRLNEAQFRQIISNLRFIRQRILVQADNIDLAATALSLVKERYQAGKATFLDVSTAELDYTTARLSHLQAIMDYKMTNYDLELLTGKEK
jgi:outer membrane protein TolC